MRALRTDASLAAAALLVCSLCSALACASKPGSNDPGNPGDGTDGGGTSNVMTATIDDGPAAAGGSADILFVSVKLCAPGSTSLCQTIDHVMVDTGSTGLRVLAEVLGSGVTASQLPAVTASGAPLVECTQFADGYSWGPVKLADLTLGGEVVGSVPIQVIGDPAFASRTIPAACSSNVDVPEDTVARFGANGVLGIGNFLQDCGDYCTSGAQDGSNYSLCPGSTSPACAPAVVPLASQVQNPAGLLAQDNDGVLIDLPAVAEPGAATASGSLVFGIGTRSNNAPGAATVLTLDAIGTFATAVGGLRRFSSSFLDTGSNALFFNDAALPACPGNASSFYCPAAQASLSATVTGQNGATRTVGFVVDNANAAFNTNFSALPGLSGPAGGGLGADTFDWGLPFFFGRRVFVGFEGRSSAGVAGPYVAF